MTWTHTKCDSCWGATEPEREPVRMAPKERELERCCWCGQWTMSGIYVRADPTTMLCVHQEED